MTEKLFPNVKKLQKRLLRSVMYYRIYLQAFM